MKKRKNIRLKYYDYKSDGYYFIIICTAKRKPVLLKFKKEIEETFKYLENKIKGFKLDFYIVMSNHLHAIFILNDAVLSLGEIVRRFKALLSKKTGIKPLWQWNYYEHVIRNERALNKIREYILNNPYQERYDFKKIYSNRKDENEYN